MDSKKNEFKNYLLKFENIEIIYKSPTQHWGITNKGLKKRISISVFNEFLKIKKLISYEDSKKIKKGINFKILQNKIEKSFNKNIIILIEHIKYFSMSLKRNNDYFSKMRELIIYKILINEIPNNFYLCNKWLKLKKGLENVLYEYCPFTIKKIGDRNTIDFIIIKESTEIKLDFKFNFINIKKYPQIIELPSYKLGNLCFGTFYYNYMNIHNISLNNYLKYLWKTDSNCYFYFLDLKKRYKENIFFKDSLKKKSNSCINLYINKVIIDINKLNIILKSINKIYLLYKDEQWFLDKSMFNHSIVIIDQIYKCHNAIYYNTNSIYILKVCLRWKNTIGVLNPSWQLSFVSKKNFVS